MPPSKVHGVDNLMSVEELANFLGHHGVKKKLH
jgi:hypothetical protein